LHKVSAPLVDFIYEDHEENLWIGSEDKGVFKIETTTQNIKNYIYNEYSKDCLYGFSVFCIYEDSKKRMWFGTDFGLNLFNRENQTFTNFTEKDGLPGNAIYGILEDGLGDLWISIKKKLTT
jgi:ligand-binding sensor domain-containing protein